MIYIVSIKTISTENKATFLKMAEELVACTRKEAGCLEYTLTANPENENMLVYIERWESQAHLDAHMQSEHMLRLRPTMTDLCEKTELLILKDALAD